MPASTAAASARRQAVLGWVMLWLGMPWLLRQPERINVSAVPAAPHVFLQLFSLHRACAGFSRQLPAIQEFTQFNP